MFEILVDVLVNLGSDLLVWMMVFLIIIIFPLSRRRGERQSLLKFLHLSSEKTEVRVFFTSFAVEPGAITDLTGEKTLWEGMAMDAGEFQAVRIIDRWLYPLVVHSGFYEYLYSHLAPSRFQVPHIQIEYGPSPHQDKNLNLSDCTVLLVGGPLHNLGTKLYFDSNMTYMKSYDWGISVEVTKGKHAGLVLGPNYTREEMLRDGFQHPNIDLAVLEKLHDQERNSTVFIASGTGTYGTMAAVHYLINNWQRLMKRHREDPFAVCLECPSEHWFADQVDSAAYLSPKVLLEVP